MIELKNTLFRYDIVKPPIDWSTDFKNPEYVFEGIGNKNKAGLFFFTDCESVAEDFGREALKRNHVTSNEYYLTSLDLLRPLKLIDFSNSINMYQMFCLLEDEGIDVLTPDFRIYESNTCKKTFEEFKIKIDKANSESNTLKKAGIINSLTFNGAINNNHAMSILGQKLTDFDNGLAFKELILKSKLDIDGYRWSEDYYNRGYSYCILNSDKLGQKNTEVKSTVVDGSTTI
jgi:hypothetical protein